jgi:hypothetical protein
VDVLRLMPSSYHPSGIFLSRTKRISPKLRILFVRPVSVLHFHLFIGIALRLFRSGFPIKILHTIFSRPCLIDAHPLSFYLIW